MCACSPETQPSPGMHHKTSGQQVEEGGSPPVPGSGETPPGVLHLVLGSSAQERYGPVRGHPEEGHKDNLKAEIPLL